MVGIIYDDRSLLTIQLLSSMKRRWSTMADWIGRTCIHVAGIFRFTAHSALLATMVGLSFRPDSEIGRNCQILSCCQWVSVRSRFRTTMADGEDDGDQSAMMGCYRSEVLMVMGFGRS
ncbi:hypothetical protein ACLOJK_040484 [Asimina triloba]